MKTSFTIYIWSVGIYAGLTLPALAIPFMYIMSLFYVGVYGWFAWAIFTGSYLLTDQLRLNYNTKMLCLSLAVVGSVAFSYQMLELLGVEENVWSSEFMLFPLAAVIAGWISLYVARNKVKADCPGYREAVNEPQGADLF